ncbi:MAG: RHS repeat-associated core domain-containing protein [Armatimonadota bacterium]
MRLNGTDLKYYHFDELGSTLFLTDANGVQTDKYVYNAWGKVVSSSGTTANPFKYVGRLGYYQDAGTGLYWVGTRFYDPDAGVFTQRDMAKDGLSYYAYTSGRSMVAVDPWGERLRDTFKFVWHYGPNTSNLFGLRLESILSPQSLDLGKMGLLDEYRKQTSDDVDTYQMMQLEYIRKDAQSICSDSSKKNKPVAIKYEPNFGMVHVQVGKDIPHYDNSLFCLGGGVLTVKSRCQATVNCQTRTLSYSCNYEYWLHDTFANPLSRTKNGQEKSTAFPDYWFGWPYSIYAHWNTHANLDKNSDWEIHF